MHVIIYLCIILTFDMHFEVEFVNCTEGVHSSWSLLMCWLMLGLFLRDLGLLFVIFGGGLMRMMKMRYLCTGCTN